MYQKAIFFAAIEISAPVERNANVESECGDDVELIRKVMQLLDAHDELFWSFLFPFYVGVIE